jgi:hypothetical protein
MTGSQKSALARQPIDRQYRSLCIGLADTKGKDFPFSLGYNVSLGQHHKIGVL